MELFCIKKYSISTFLKELDSGKYECVAYIDDPSTKLERSRSAFVIVEGDLYFLLNFVAVSYMLGMISCERDGFLSFSITSFYVNSNSIFQVLPEC